MYVPACVQRFVRSHDPKPSRRVRRRGGVVGGVGRGKRLVRGQIAVKTGNEGKEGGGWVEGSGGAESLSGENEWPLCRAV